MSASRLSLVMGSSRPSQDNDPISLPLPETGTIYVHLHFDEGDVVHTLPVPQRRGGWIGLVAGLAVVAAFVGGYQIGHRLPQHDVSDLRPSPMPSAFIPAPTGFPAIERQLATQPVILAPSRPTPEQTTDHLLDPAGGPPPALASTNTPTASTPTSPPVPARNAFGLEN